MNGRTPDAPFTVDLRGQVAVVTGASRGIGRACALALATAGADVVLGLRHTDSDRGIVDEVERLGRRVLVVQLDVSNVAQVRQAVGKIEASFGKVDILVNNAGIGPPNPIDQVSETDFDATVAVNLKGTFFVSQAIGKLMVARRSGRIINLSSQAGFIALPTESVYCMTKAAIAHLTKCFALEWGPFNVNVNAVAPTFIKTPGTEKWLQDPAFKAKVISSIPLGRVGEPSDVTGAVLFLASSAASLITGTTLLIDGGWTVS
jgi:NAD(P)-dependent dehydrogenase (short-subunit alcohol dehydrogenase family)